MTIDDLYKIQQSYLSYSTTQLSLKNATEILVLSRRLQYLTLSNSENEDDNNDFVLSNLEDVNSTDKVIKSLSTLVKTNQYKKTRE